MKYKITREEKFRSLFLRNHYSAINMCYLLSKNECDIWLIGWPNKPNNTKGKKPVSERKTNKQKNPPQNKNPPRNEKKKSFVF